MRKVVSILLAVVFAFGMVGCSKTSEAPEPVQVKPYKQLYDYIQANGRDMEGNKALVVTVDGNYITVEAKAENTIEFTLLSEVEGMKTKMAITMVENQSQHEVSLETLIEDVKSTYSGTINPGAYDAENPHINSFSSQSDESLHEDEKAGLAAGVNYLLMLSDLVIEASGVAVKDMGYTKFVVE